MGLYYEGFVEDIDLVRQKHLTATVSSFGIRRSRSNVNPAETQSVEKCDDHNDKENKMSIYLNSYIKFNVKCTVTDRSVVVGLGHM